MEIAFPMKNLTLGQHTLTFTVHDVAGNETSHTIKFFVGSNNAVALSTAEIPAIDKATFLLNASTQNTPTVHLKVTDAAGNLVWAKKTDNFPYTWDLKDKNGNKPLKLCRKAPINLPAPCPKTPTPKSENASKPHNNAKLSKKPPNTSRKTSKNSKLKSPNSNNNSHKSTNNSPIQKPTKTAQRLKISIVRKPKPLKRSKRRSNLGCKPKPTSTKPWQPSKIDDETTHHIHAHLFVFGDHVQHLSIPLSIS